MAKREKNTAQAGAGERADRFPQSANQGTLRSAREQIVFLYFLIVGIFGKVIMNTAGLDFISFGILCALVGFTGYNDTLLLQVLTGHPALIRVITYVCLIFLPYLASPSSPAPLAAAARSWFRPRWCCAWPTLPSRCC